MSASANHKMLEQRSQSEDRAKGLLAAGAELIPVPARPQAEPCPSLAQARLEAFAAMKSAAAWLSIDPAALSADAYRAFREGEGGSALPTALTISILFAGWQRAREHVASLTYDDQAIEAEVTRAVCGDPACLHRAYGPGAVRQRSAPDGSY